METLQQIPNLNLVILIAAGVVIGLILFKVAQRILKTILILAVVGLAIFFWRGGTVDQLGQEGVDLFFKESTLDNMVAVNCPDSKREKAKCDCVVVPVFEDLDARLSSTEKSQVNQDWEALKREIRASMNGNKEIQNCLVNNHGKKYLDSLGDFFKDLKNKE